jgi:NADH-quinone oxidoreductase subunit K
MFSIGLFGVLTRRNAIGILLGIEVMLNAVNINLVAASKAHENLGGQIFAFFAIAVTVAEIAVGLAILILIFRLKKSIEADHINLMKW